MREPAKRLWSAWQSKLLLREPRFVEDFGAEPWFPRLPEDPAGIVEDFRRFVAAVGDGAAVDVHWAVQSDLVGQLPLSHVGRLEEMGADAAAARGARRRRGPGRHGRGARTAARCRCPTTPTTTRRPRSPASTTRATSTPTATRSSRRARGGDWERDIAPLLPVLGASIDERERLGQLHRVAQRRLRRVQAAERRLETAGNWNSGTTRSPAITNVEEETDYNVRWEWGDERLEPGFTAVMRVKNEARSLPWSLPPLLRAARRVVMVDNGSTDGTVRVARAIAEEHGAADRFEVRSYPFSIARCGAEHLATPAKSVHSLVHFYNWSFSLVRTSQALKWDGDMVLTDAAVATLRDLAWQLDATEAVIRIPRHSLYVADERHGFVDVGLQQLRGVGLAEQARLQLRQGDRVGAADVGRQRRIRRAAGLVVRRAQAPRRGRVRALVRHRLHVVGAHPAQGPRVGGVPRARGRREAARRRRACAVAAGRARDRPRPRHLAPGARSSWLSASRHSPPA